MAESTLKQKTATGLFWGGISSGIQQLIGVVFGIFLARILTPDDYGLVGMLAIFSGIAAITINSGFSTALTNKQDADHSDYNAVFWFTVFVSIFFYLIFFFCAPLIAAYYDRPELTTLSRVIFLSFIFSGISIVSFTVLFKQLNVKRQAQIDMFSMLISGSVGVFLAMNGFAYWAIAIQFVLLNILSCSLRLIIAPWRPTWKLDFSPLRSMLPFSIKLYITGIFSQITGNIFSVLIGKFYNATQLGYYSQGQKWMGMGQVFIGGTFNAISQPVLAQINEDKERQVKVLRKLIRFGAFVSFPLMLGLAFVGKEFILITVGEKWLPSVPFLQLFCIWGAVCFLSTLYINLICASGKSNLYMYGTIITGVLQLLVVLCMYPLGIFSMVIGYIVMCFVGLGIWQYYTSKLIGLRLKYVLKDTLPYLIITFGCLFITWLLTKNILNLYALIVSKIAIAIVLYFSILKLSNATTFKESTDFLLKYIRK